MRSVGLRSTYIQDAENSSDVATAEDIRYVAFLGNSNIRFGISFHRDDRPAVNETCANVSWPPMERSVVIMV